jgi:hypothetical protein
LPPGVILSVAWNPNYYIGKRVIPLHGQGIPISDYPELVNATYVGDSLNELLISFINIIQVLMLGIQVVIILDYQIQKHWYQKEEEI